MFKARHRLESGWRLWKCYGLRIPALKHLLWASSRLSGPAWWQGSDTLTKTLHLSISYHHYDLSNEYKHETLWNWSVLTFSFTIIRGWKIQERWMQAVTYLQGVWTRNLLVHLSLPQVTSPLSHISIIFSRPIFSPSRTPQNPPSPNPPKPQFPPSSHHVLKFPAVVHTLSPTFQILVLPPSRNIRPVVYKVDIGSYVPHTRRRWKTGMETAFLERHPSSGRVLVHPGPIRRQMQWVVGSKGLERYLRRHWGQLFRVWGLGRGLLLVVRSPSINVDVVHSSDAICTIVSGRFHLNETEIYVHAACSTFAWFRPRRRSSAFRLPFGAWGWVPFPDVEDSFEFEPDFGVEDELKLEVEDAFLASSFSSWTLLILFPLRRGALSFQRAQRTTTGINIVKKIVMLITTHNFVDPDMLCDCRTRTSRMARCLWEIDGAWSSRGLHGACFVVDAVPYWDFDGLYAGRLVAVLKSLCCGWKSMSVFEDGWKDCCWTVANDGQVWSREIG